MTMLDIHINKLTRRAICKCKDAKATVLRNSITGIGSGILLSSPSPDKIVDAANREEARTAKLKKDLETRRQIFEARNRLDDARKTNKKMLREMKELNKKDRWRQ